MKRTLSSSKKRALSQENTPKDKPSKTYASAITKNFYNKDVRKPVNNLNNIFSINDRYQSITTKQQLKNNFTDLENSKKPTTFYNDDTKPIANYLTKKLFNAETNSKIVKAKRKRLGNTTASSIVNAKDMQKKDNIKESQKSILNPNKQFKEVNRANVETDFYQPFQKKNSVQFQNSSAFGQNNGNTTTPHDLRARHNSFTTYNTPHGGSNVTLNSRPLSKSKPQDNSNPNIFNRVNYLDNFKRTSQENSPSGITKPSSGNPMASNYLAKKKSMPVVMNSISTGNNKYLSSLYNSNTNISPDAFSNVNKNNFISSLQSQNRNSQNNHYREQSNDTNTNKVPFSKGFGYKFAESEPTLHNVNKMNLNNTENHISSSSNLQHLVKKPSSLANSFERGNSTNNYMNLNNIASKKKNSNFKSLSSNGNDDNSSPKNSPENQRQNNYQEKASHLENKKFQSNDKNPENLEVAKNKNFTLTYACRTRQGFSTNVMKKKNQDGYFNQQNFLGNENLHCFCVCDGHGVYGDRVSKFVTSNLPFFIEESLKKNIPGLSHATSDPSKNSLKSQQPIEELLFLAVDKTVKKMLRSKLDVLFSGTTCNFCLLKDEFLYVTNIGDSRSVIGYLDNNTNGFKSKPLSFDHKPDILTEKQRILRNNGRISPMLNHHGRYVGPDRVWLKDEDVPGLAMSRSIGDLVAASVGVTWKPEIAIYKLSPEDKIILIASDGIWEVLDNDDVINILKPYYNSGKIENAADQLMKECVKLWSKESVIDDITIIVIFINWNNETTKVQTKVNFAK